MMDDINERRAEFVYDAARLAALAAGAPIVLVPWLEREQAFMASTMTRFRPFQNRYLQGVKRPWAPRPKTYSDPLNPMEFDVTKARGSILKRFFNYFKERGKR